MKSRIAVLASVLLLGACAQLPDPSESAVMNLFVVTPQAPDMRYQIEIAKLTDLANHQNQLDDASMAQLLYRRGSLYDALGLSGLARIDLNRALERDPRLADAYNFLGIQYTEIEQYNYAYEMFDSALELEPEHPYALLNRGMTAYYDGRIDLASKDYQRYFESQPDDPYRVLWLYLAEVETDAEAARRNLAERRIKYANGAWGWVLNDLLLGVVDEQSFLNDYAPKHLGEDETLAERMCESYFYLGKLKQLEGNNQAAAVYFRLALTTNVYRFLEHRYAGIELQRSQQALEQQASSTKLDAQE